MRFVSLFAITELSGPSQLGLLRHVFWKSTWEENMEGKRNISVLMTVVLQENRKLERRDQGKVSTIYLRWVIFVNFNCPGVIFPCAVRRKVGEYEKWKVYGAVFATLLAAQLNRVTDFMVPGILVCVFSKARPCNIYCANSVKFLHLTDGFKKEVRRT